MLFSIKKILSILLIIFFISFFIESPFRKGGISLKSQLLLIGLTFGLSLIYSIQRQNKEFSQIQKFVKFLSVVLSTGIGLAISTIISHDYLEKLYGLDFQLYLNETISTISFLTISFLISALQIEILNKILKSYNYN